MKGQYPRRVAAAALLLVVMSGAGAQAQKPGGVLFADLSPRQPGEHVDPRGRDQLGRDPNDGGVQQPRAYDQHVAQNSLDTIVPDLAESWSWNEERTRVTFRLREGVKWHDGKPFTSADIKCTWDLLTGRAGERLRLNPRKSWWNNVAEIAANGPAEATFVLKRPQPAILALIASGYTPIYPCQSRRAICGSILLARAPSNSSSSNQTSRSSSSATRIIGNRDGPISTASNIRSSLTARPRSSPSSPASST
jgi:peptide/nickel transport system substrate-binding protein